MQARRVPTARAIHKNDLPLGTVLLESGNIPITHDKGASDGYCTITAIPEFCPRPREG
jgi:hypothetical protein